MLEYLDDSVRSVEDVSKVLRLPTLAAIPALKRGSGPRRLLSSPSTSLLQTRNGNGNGDGNGNGYSRTNFALPLELDHPSPLHEACLHLRLGILLSSP